MPLAKSTLASPASSAANLSSTTRSPGLPYRPYSSRGWPCSRKSTIAWVSGNVYVDAAKIGSVIEKPGFTRASPACTDSVDGPEAVTFFVEGSGIVGIGSTMGGTTNRFL